MYVIRSRWLLENFYREGRDRGLSAPESLRCITPLREEQLVKSLAAGRALVTDRERQAEENPYAIVRYLFTPFLLSAVVTPGLQACPIKPLYNDIAGDLQVIYEVSREISFNALNTYFLKVFLEREKINLSIII